MFKKTIARILFFFRNFSPLHKSLVIGGIKSKPHFFIDSAYINIGKSYIKNCKNARAANSKDSLANIPFELVYANDLLLGIVGGMLEENNGKRVPVENKAVSRKFVLTAAFIQGISLCEQSILESLYLQAGNLIRQEFEVLGLLVEINKNKRKDGKQVNVKHARWNGSKYYGELSSLAHLSDHKIVESIVGYQTTWGDFAATVPQYQKDNTIKLYGFHVAMILGLVEELKHLYDEIYAYKLDERENDVLVSVEEILRKHKVFKP